MHQWMFFYNLCQTFVVLPINYFNCDNLLMSLLIYGSNVA